MTGLLGGRTALVTGGGGGIGAATCRRFVDEGARVVVLDRNEDTGRAVADDLDAHFIPCDVADRDALTAAVEESVDVLGGLTTLVNNAGFGMLKQLHTYSDEEWDRLLAVNLTATFVATRAAVPHLRAAGAGSIVNNVGGVGVRPTRGEAPYSAAKAGMIALTKSAAVEYAPEIRVNAVSPTFAETALTAPLLADASVRADVEARIPFGRVGTAEEVADTIVFLASDLARYVTGLDLVVDGGAQLTSAQADHLLEAFLDG
ncbi:MAG: SDR family NAD(P)-dependent oxidoreductase [Acidimicrobiales bacterium]|nr:SDR family NAD(P)-dependent oxidoreductase [Acidimicrobiales bacterium]